MTIVNTEDAVQAETAEPADSRPMQARIWDEAGEDAREYLRRVTAMIGLRGIDAHTLAQLAPQFDLLPYAEAVSRHCVLMRDENARLLLVLADPFDGNVRVWAMQRIKRVFAFTCCVPSDLSAYMAVHEGSQQALNPVNVGEGQAAVADTVADSRTVYHADIVADCQSFHRVDFHQ